MYSLCRKRDGQGASSLSRHLAKANKQTLSIYTKHSALTQNHSAVSEMRICTVDKFGEVRIISFDRREPKLLCHICKPVHEANIKYLHNKQCITHLTVHHRRLCEGSSPTLQTRLPRAETQMTRMWTRRGMLRTGHNRYSLYKCVG